MSSMNQALGIINQAKQDLTSVNEGLAPRRKRFIEQKESLACQKLLYPSKFRKDPYRSKVLDSPQETKLPSIIKQRANNA